MYPRTLIFGCLREVAALSTRTRELDHQPALPQAEPCPGKTVVRDGMVSGSWHVRPAGGVEVSRRDSANSGEAAPATSRPRPLRR